MRCEALKSTLSGQCGETDGVEVARWAPTPLTTRVYRLCFRHRSALALRGCVPTKRDVEEREYQ